MGDCIVEVGTILDSTPYPNYARRGGVRINCMSTHQFIAATVVLMFHDGIRWQTYGALSYYPLYNSSGYGTGIGYTNRYCVGTNQARYGYWLVRAVVWTDRVPGGVTTYSVPVRDPTGAGC